MINGPVSLVALLWLVGGHVAENYPTCLYDREPIGNRKHIYSPNYPEKYTAGTHCRWIEKNSSPIRLTCSVFNIPASRNCQLDAVAVDNGITTRRYCGNRTFSVVGQSNKTIITLETGMFSPGGNFRCTIEPVCECGRKNPSRIVGGANTGPNEYPMMAGLIDRVNRMLFCGATILNEKQVLTAAHCIFTKRYDEYGVLVGGHDLFSGSPTNTAELLRVQSAQIHSKYNLNFQGHNDIALITINGIISFNFQVGAVCLPFQHSNDSFAGSEVDVVGWGTTEFGGRQSKILQKASKNVITVSKCSGTYRHLTNDDMCTQKLGKDSCQFDSGGPVLWQNPDTRRMILIGIIREGGACNSGHPALNTRVGAFVDWIVERAPQGFSYCTEE